MKVGAFKTLTVLKIVPVKVLKLAVTICNIMTQREDVLAEQFILQIQSLYLTKIVLTAIQRQLLTYLNNKSCIFHS